MEEHSTGTFPLTPQDDRLATSPCDSSPPHHLTTSSPADVQPGGGFVINLELAWGRLRRAYLRRFRPGYVQRMAEKRQGSCPNCSHDIVDPRDLKFCRNVCGYWFHPEDDPFRWREKIPVARAGWAEVILFSVIGLVLAGVFAAAAVWAHSLFWAPAAVVLL